MFGNLEFKIKSKTSKLESLDLRAESTDLSREDLWELSWFCDFQLFQSSKVKWHKEEDVNFGYFLACVR